MCFRLHNYTLCGCLENPFHLYEISIAEIFNKESCELNASFRNRSLIFGLMDFGERKFLRNDPLEGHIVESRSAMRWRN